VHCIFALLARAGKLQTLLRAVFAVSSRLACNRSLHCKGFCGIEDFVWTPSG